MRTTVDLPDTLFRRTKALAAVRGSSMKELIVKAIEHEVNSPQPRRAASPITRVELPVVHLRNRRKLDLSGFDFDDLLA